MININPGSYKSDNILLEKELVPKLEELRKQGKKIGLCTGSFDLLHPGHITHFEAAKKVCPNGCSNGKCSSSGGGGHNPPLNEYQDNKNNSLEIIGKTNGIYNYTNLGLLLNQSIKKVQTNEVQTKKNNYLLFIDILLLLLIILLILIVISVLLR
jgi:hypothetical protein